MDIILPSAPLLTYEITEKIFIKVWSYMSVNPIIPGPFDNQVFVCTAIYCSLELDTLE